MRAGIGEIKIDLTANEIVHDHVLARRTKPQRTLVFENVSSVLKLFQIALINFGALALKIRTAISADVRTFVPVNAQPLQAFINRGRGFLGIALGVSVFDSKNQFAAMMVNEEPVKERSARPADVQITGGRRRETDANFRT